MEPPAEKEAAVPLDPARIRAALLPACRDGDLEVHPLIDSTNTRARELLSRGAPHHSAVLAEAQTAGRGRRGRSFFSPAGSGLYMTMILRLDRELADAQLATVTAAVAVCRALDRVLPGIGARIKWVNDIFLGGRKACGILAEAGEIRNGRLDGMIVGVGINVSTAVFPPELRDIAAALPGGGTVDRNRLAAEIMNAFFTMSDNSDNPDGRAALLNAYRERSLVLGREVTYAAGRETVTARAVAVNDAGNLVVRLPDGTETALHSGEISVRLAD